MKLDMSKELTHLYMPLLEKVTPIRVPKLNLLMVDGRQNWCI